MSFSEAHSVFIWFSNIGTELLLLYCISELIHCKGKVIFRNMQIYMSISCIKIKNFFVVSIKIANLGLR